MADLELKQIKDWFDEDYTSNQTTRIAAADDRVFAYVTMWDSVMLDASQLAYKGEFNIVRKATRHIMGDLRTNQVQIDFEPKAESRDDGADLLDGLYLSDDRLNSSLEAYSNCDQETVDCGIGGWELYTTYESTRSGDKKQVIRRRPIYEFNNNAFPDSNAKLLDKSDAKRWTILEAFSKTGYQDIYKELTGKETDAAPVNFASPECSYVFPWVTGNDIYYIARFYHKKEIKDKILTMTDPLGQPLKLRESDLKEKGIMDELIDQGYSIVSEKKIKRWQVKCYVCSGEDILKKYVVAGEHIPVVPMYGERAFVEGEEHYEGVIRLAKDPQRLRNFLMSYLGDMVSRSPREKPIFGAEQLAGFEHMYEINGADNNYPYVLQHLKGSDGMPLPQGPVGTLNPPQLNSTVSTLLELSRQGVEDVADPGLPKELTDADLSGRAVELLTARLDQQSIVYQENKKHAKRYDAVVYASMACDVYDSPREMTVTLPDGTRKKESIMSTIIDEETGDPKVINDLTNMEFDVYAKIGPTYDSLKEKTRDQLAELAEAVKETDQNLHKALIYKGIELMNGANMNDIKSYTRKQLLLMGITEPETDEDKAFMEQAANQPKEPDASMVLAKAELLKGQADLMEQERQAVRDQKEDENADAKLQVEAYNAETKRREVDVRAAQAGLDTELTRVKITGQKISNAQKILEPFRSRVNA